jgi:dynein heavy chain, axonemal
MTCIGDTLIAAEFVSYIGAFSKSFREEIIKDKWLPDIFARNIPCTEGVDPLDILCTPAQIAKWKNEKLPEDRMSIENAAIVTSCTRWPLFIDP